MHLSDLERESHKGAGAVSDEKFQTSARERTTQFGLRAAIPGEPAEVFGAQSKHQVTDLVPSTSSFITYEYRFAFVAGALGGVTFISLEMSEAGASLQRWLSAWK